MDFAEPLLQTNAAAPAMKTPAVAAADSTSKFPKGSETSLFRAADATDAIDEKHVDEVFADDDAFEAAALDIQAGAIAVKDGISNIIATTIHKAQDVGHAIKERLVGTPIPSPTQSPAPPAVEGDSEIEFATAKDTKEEKEKTKSITASTEQQQDKLAEQKPLLARNDEEQADSLFESAKETLHTAKDSAKETIRHAVKAFKEKTSSGSSNQEEEGLVQEDEEAAEWERDPFDAEPQPSSMKTYEAQKDNAAKKFEKEWPRLPTPEPDAKQEATNFASELQEWERSKEAQVPLAQPLGAWEHAPAPLVWQNANKAPMHN